MKLIHSIILKDYPTHYNQSNKQRATYYDFLKDIGYNTTKYPKKYQKDSNQYDFLEINKKGKVYYRLFNLIEGEAVIKNEAKVGTPKVKAIRGNDLFNLQSQAHNTTKILDVIKAWFLSHWTIEDKNIVLSTIEYPIVLRLIFRSPRSQVQDIGNLKIFFEKAIPDVLQTTIMTRKSNKDKYIKIPNPLGFLPDDNVDYNNRISSEWKVSETRELELKIYSK